jgi:hypothetical protein
MHVIKNKMYFLQTGRSGAAQIQVDKTRQKIVQRFLRESPFFKMLNEITEKESLLINED